MRCLVPSFFTVIGATGIIAPLAVRIAAQRQLDRSHLALGIRPDYLIDDWVFRFIQLTGQALAPALATASRPYARAGRDAL